jgi:hypothetical protein
MKRLLLLAFAVCLCLVTFTPALHADSVPDPTMIISDPPDCTQSLSLSEGSSFSFSATETGGGEICVSNNTGNSWLNVLVNLPTSTVWPNGSVGCAGENGFVSCSEVLDGNNNVMSLYFSNVDPFCTVDLQSTNESLNCPVGTGITPGSDMRIDLFDQCRLPDGSIGNCTTGGWGAFAQFENAQVNVDASQLRLVPAPAPTVAPEPGSVLLLGSGLMVLFGRKRLLRRK